MYVCVCKGVTDTDIRQEVSLGVTRLVELNAKTGVASQCGRCAECALEVIRSCHEQGCQQEP